MTTQSLPRIVRFLETLDAPGSACPHCGAKGRFILRFVVDDGRELAAMRGCTKLFPVSQLAVEDLRLRTKQADYARRGWVLNRADADARYQVEQFFAGRVDERAALAAIARAKKANQAKYRR